MNKNQFTDFLLHPEKLSGENIALLEKLVKEFPYCQTAHLLYVKNLYNQNSIHYSNQLKIAAAYSTDRKVLYQLITQKEAVSEVEKPIEQIEKKNETNIEKKPEKVKAPQPDYPVIPSLEQEIIKEAISASIELEVTRFENDVVSEKKSSTQEEKQIKITPASIDLDQKHSFSEWLKLASQKNIDLQTQDILFDKKLQADLIDKFILDEPRISKPKVEFFSPSNMANKSVQEDDTFVTETLAKIYLKQGNLLKALKAYQALHLKYPEKRLIFAAQIEKLEELIHRNKI